jgi:sugar transferase (PEP-CTERM/EpsH1 system associated)
VREPILYLTHRIPYPPDKGDKVRSYHLLRHLAARYRVHLGTFVDDDADWRHLDAVRALCDDTYFGRIHPRLARVRSLGGLLTGDPLTLRYFRDAQFQAWVDRAVAARGIAKAVVFSSAMAQYVLKHRALRRIVDFVDVDSDKWRLYAGSRRSAAAWLYRREARALLEFERRTARECDAGFFVTPQETALFRKLAPECANRVETCANGVDGDWFAPSAGLASPYPAGERPIVFTGAMDYWPNIDAVSWFAREALPRIRGREPAARFYVVGMNPAPAVGALAKDAAVRVTDRVPDVRPYLQHAAVAVAPLRIARGIQNKVLEAMAMAKPVVVSAPAAAALSARPGSEIEVAADATEFAAKTLDLLATARGVEMGRAARRRVLADYDWDKNLRCFDDALSPSPPTGERAGVRGTASLSPSGEGEGPFPLSPDGGEGRGEGAVVHP